MRSAPSKTLESLPVVAFDEAGNSGQNLLDPEQPVFVLASVHLPTARATELLEHAMSRRASEAKFSSLRQSNSGRKRILTLLNTAKLTTSDLRIAVYHKSFMITTKIVDMLVETLLHSMGVDLYVNAGHLALSNLLHTVIPAYCGPTAFRAWQASFVQMVRRKSAESVAAFYEATDELRSVNANQRFDEILGMLAATRSIVDEGIPESDPVAVDPAIPTLVALAAQWTAALRRPFELVHDNSKPIAYNRDTLRHLLDVSEPPRVFGSGDFEIALPIGAHDIRFADSRDLPQLQVADLYAGAAAFVMRARANGYRESFAEDLVEAGIVNLVTNPVWPDTAVSPSELGADLRAGSAQLDVVVELLQRGRDGLR